MAKSEGNLKKGKKADAGFEWILWGVLLAVIKLVYSFFPFSNVIDFFLFAIVGAFIQKNYKNKGLPMILAVLPGMVVISYFLFVLGWENISKGVGTAWLISFLILPVSALLGGFLQERKEKKKM